MMSRHFHGRTFYHRKKFNRAENCFRLAIERSLTAGVTRRDVYSSCEIRNKWWLAASQLRTGRATEAAELIRHLLEDEKHGSQAWLHSALLMGMTFIVSSECEEAINQFDVVISKA